jgi:hypothetical protein
MGTLLMTDTPAAARKTPLWGKLLLVIGGVGFALLLVMLLLNLFPSLVRDADRYTRRDAGTTVQVNFRHTDSDLFAAMPGRIRPPADDAVIASFALSWDADGWRVPAAQADHYPIAAFGDSFTEAYNAAIPWPDRLAEALNVPVRNYGYRGYGPLEIRAAAEAFAGKEPRSWVLWAYFAGNDLVDAQRSSALAERSPFYLLPQLAEQAADRVATEAAQNTDQHFDFPMPVIIGGNFYEMAFLPYYLWRQPAPAEGYTGSLAYQSVGETLAAISAAAPDACRALVFIPPKDQLYYRYIHPDVRQWLRGQGQEQYLDDSGWLHMRPKPVTPEAEDAFIASLTDQRDAIRALVEAQPGWRFIDLTPALQARADAGDLLYYPYDSHWNPLGHEVAAAAVAEALQAAAPACPLSR